MSIDSDTTIELLTVFDVAKLLKISQTGVYRLKERRLVPFSKVMGKILFEKRDILAYLRKNRTESIDSYT